MIQQEVGSQGGLQEGSDLQAIFKEQVWDRQATTQEGRVRQGTGAAESRLCSLITVGAPARESQDRRLEGQRHWWGKGESGFPVGPGVSEDFVSTAIRSLVKPLPSRSQCPCLCNGTMGRRSG